ncbi:MAG: tetratricopeptide repeat protein [Acidobacteria bacterium]|nr:tetratricopeptide repeat protein [Acidobacteriota bacterium]
MKRWWAVTALALAALPATASVWGEEQGKRPAALEPCDASWDRGDRAAARQCYTDLLRSDDLAARAEAWWALGDVKSANEVFRDAIKAQPENPDLRVRWGYLYLQTHQEGEALALFGEALEIDEKCLPAKLGLARVFAERFEDKAQKLVDEALEANPESVEAHLLQGRLRLEVSNLAEADKSLDKALELAAAQQRSPLELYALKASVDLLRETTDSEWTKKALEYNPRYGEIYSIPARYYIITRRYREAIELYEKAVQVDPENWSAHADLGVNLLREAREQEGRKHLEIAFQGDPFSAKTVNTLRLLDSFEHFKTFSNKDLLRDEGLQPTAEDLAKPEVIVRLHEKEADLLRPYVIELADEAVASFSKKYGFTPQRPVWVELYPDHDDFAVRTMGMPGVGLLGVTFGYLVAMDSPSGRKPGSFHWGTTLWHEMAHVFTLEATDHLVPRWFSEGVSMYEEWEARPNWGEQISPDFINALQEGKLLPVADLDEGFIRPSYPNQIAVSYFQAGLICRLIDREWGTEKLVAMLTEFGKDRSTADAIRTALGVEPEEFDERFNVYLKMRLGAVAEKEGLEKWRKEWKALLEAAREKDWSAVIEKGESVKELYPDYVEAGNAYVALAQAYEEEGARDKAIAELEQYRDHGGRQPETLEKLAGWLQEADRRDDSIKTLTEVIYIWPGDEGLHVSLGEQLLAAGRSQEALREFRAALAMGPIDKAAAHYRLAEAYYKLSDRPQTRRHLLYALEAAPGYRPAQKLLLEISKN